MLVYLGCKRPIIKRSEYQSPILDIQPPDLRFDVDTFMRWKTWICECLEEGLSARSQRPIDGETVQVKIATFPNHRETLRVPDSGLQTLPFQHEQPSQTIIPLLQHRISNNLLLVRYHAHPHYRTSQLPGIRLTRLRWS